MPKNFGVNDKLLRQAQKLGGLKTKRETVDTALAEFIRRRRQKEIVKLFGTVDFREDWDPIRERHSQDDLR
jgi:Arc/MetJ family transcription regulator